MKEVNKSKEVDNTDKKLHISDVSDSKLQKLDEYIETRLNELSKLTSMDRISQPDWRGNRQEEDVLR
jgi:hypothetical protein